MFSKSHNNNCFSINNTDKPILDKGATDLLKFLCCIMVSMHHYVQTWYKTGGEHNLLFDAFSSQGGYLGVAVFFFLSGYGLMMSWNKQPMTFAQFLWKRIRKVYLPVVFISLIWCVCLCLLAPKLTLRPELTELLPCKNLSLGLLATFALVSNDGALWFIKAILFLYLMFFVAVRTKEILVNHISNTESMQFIKNQQFIEILEGGVIFIALVSTVVVWRWMGSNFCISVPLFFLGMVVAEYGANLKHNLRKTVIATLIVLIVSIAIFVFFRNGLLIHAWVNYAVVACLIWLFTRFVIVMPSLPSWLGKSSFDVYLTHNKAKLVLFGLIPLPKWYLFVGASIALAFCFYWLRKLIRL